MVYRRFRPHVERVDGTDQGIGPLRDKIMKAVTERYAPSLRQVVERLARLARSLHSEGLKEQAKSIETTIADLEWQCEELDSNELTTVA